ncbi:hypothetical protein EDC96DRAFT_547572 [Choanephora cucurbitarum]|nr:hypothetical protein EDC96DRAFT_547572 [Choanephora cucurbitarum]
MSKIVWTVSEGLIILPRLLLYCYLTITCIAAQCFTLSRFDFLSKIGFTQIGISFDFLQTVLILLWSLHAILFFKVFLTVAQNISLVCCAYSIPCFKKMKEFRLIADSLFCSSRMVVKAKVMVNRVETDYILVRTR